MKVEEDAVEEMIQQNLMTSLRLSQMTAKRLMKQAEGRGEGEAASGSIINLSSIAASRTQGSLMGYSIACAAVDQMTRSMAVALAPQGIRVNAVAFGSVLSGSLQAALKQEPDWRGVIEAGTPLGRVAPAAEIVETVQYLASDASSFLTGQVLTVDGGRSLLDVVSAPAH